MSKLSIYTVGGTVQASGGVYIARQADADLLKLCQNRIFAYALASRQVGKSSLMVRTAEELTREGMRAIIVDLTQFGVQVTADSWYLGLLTSIIDQLALKCDVVEWWRERHHFGTAQRLTNFFHEVILPQIAEPIVVFIDEVDSTLSLSFTDDFYAAIRFFYNARAREPEYQRLTFVLIGVATPSDLIKDPYRTPFNIGQQVNIADFTFVEALPLAAGFNLAPKHAQQVLQWVMQWTGGHPYLTQRLCRAIAEGAYDEGTEAAVTQAVHRTFLGRMSEEDNNLQFVRDMLTKRAPDKLRVLELYKRIRQRKPPVRDEEQSPIIAHLKLSGIVRREGTVLAVRNRIYHEVFDEHWIREHWPVSWHKTIPLYVRTIAIAMFSLLVTSVIVLTMYVRTLQDLANRDAELVRAQKEATDRAQRFAQQEGELRQAAETRRLEAETARTRAEHAVVAEALARSQAEAAKVRAQREEVVADSLRKEEEQARHVAEDRRRDVERRRQIDIARYLATQAPLQHQLGHPERAALLARQAFLFNNRNGGPWLNQIYHSMIETLAGEGGPFLLRAHTGGVRSVVFSADGEWLASSSDDGTLRLWSKQKDFVESQVLAVHEQSVRVSLFGSKNGDLISGSDDKTVQWWNLRQEHYTSTPLLGHRDRVWAMTLNTNRGILATGGADSCALLWDLQEPNGGAFAKLLHSSWIRAIAFSADERILAIGGEDGIVTLWTFSQATRQPTKSRVFKHDGGLRSLAFHPEYSVLFTGGRDGRVLKWILDAPEEAPQAWIAHAAAVNSLTISKEGHWLATGSFDKDAKLWDIQDGSSDPILTFPHDDFVWSVAFNSDASLLAVGSEDKNIYLWLTKSEALAAKICEKAKRSLSHEEWREFVGADIQYESTCSE